MHGKAKARSQEIVIIWPKIDTIEEEKQAKEQQKLRAIAMKANKNEWTGNENKNKLIMGHMYIV